MSAVRTPTRHKRAPQPRLQSAAAPSPFPPIAEYAFLSDCHTGALVAPDGAIGWLCVPRFDAASVFGTLLDREAGYFRLAPFGINVPSSRRYEPGTNTLETTWHAPGGPVAVLRAFGGGGPCPAVRSRRRGGAPRRDDAVLARVAVARAPARPRVALLAPALGADDQGPHVHADRRDGRGADDLAA